MGGAVPVIPTQEQLEALHKKQLELFAYIEQQKQRVQAGAASPELIPFPVNMWPFLSSPLLAATTTTTAGSSATPSPTQSNSSTESAFSGSSDGTSTSSLLSSQRRPLSGTASLPSVLDTIKY